MTPTPQSEPKMPAAGPLLDTFGRIADDLRISVTDKCNFRCTYCMPAEGLVWLPKAEILTYEEIVRLVDVFAGLGVKEVKLTGGVVAGTNEDEVVDFARFSRQSGYEVRFIEYMPLEAEQKWERAKVVPAAEILDAIDRVHPLVAEETGGVEPATRFRFADGSPGAIGVIASVTEPFCDTCNRLRITADGQLRACLFAMQEADLRTPLRAGASDAEIEAVIRAAVWAKWEGHK